MLKVCTKKHYCVRCSCRILPGELELSKVGHNGRQQFSHENDAACTVATTASIDEAYDDPDDMLRYLGMETPGSLADPRPGSEAILAAKKGLHVIEDSPGGTRRPKPHARIIDNLDDGTVP